VRIDDFLPAASDALRAASARAADFFTPAARLGVTGLSGSGKTVFITALVRNLVAGGRLPFFAPVSEGRVSRAYLEPQPDDGVPRFDYEANLARLARDPPDWPEGTRQISQLRLTIEYQSRSALGRAFGPSRLHLDIVDYPGEWLIDLSMLGQDFAAWSAEALALAREPRRLALAQPFLAFLETAVPGARDSERTAIEGARLYTAYLIAARGADRLSVLGPGRFLTPGDLAGAPLLAFFPLHAAAAPEPLRRMLEKRFESYKARCVRPFFRDHFSKLDRQIVLVDALAAIGAGPEAVLDLERALTAVLQAFRPGAGSWLAALMGSRIDRILFAATKADHLHRADHDRLEAILRLLTDRAATRAAAAGAGIRVMALAALRATRETEARAGTGPLPCVAGVPLAGETAGGRRFDGRTETVIFPGDLPSDPRDVFDPARAAALANQFQFPRFRPARFPPEGADEARALPHIRLDRALDFLLSDRLR